MKKKIPISYIDLTIIKEMKLNGDMITPYSLYMKFGYPPSTISRFIWKFKKLNLITEEGDKIKITEKGNNWIESNKKIIYLTPKNKFWKKVPEDMLMEKQTGCYFPDLEKIDMDFFDELRFN